MVMSHIRRYVMAIVCLAAHLQTGAQRQMVFLQGRTVSAIPMAVIDSLKPTAPLHFDVYSKRQKLTVQADSICFNRCIDDTIVVKFHDDEADIVNPRLDIFNVAVDKAYVSITAKGKTPFTCKATGTSSDGRLMVDADTTCTIVLDGLQLASRTGCAISLTQKQKVQIELPAGTTTTLADATEYADSTDGANGCLYAKGSLLFSGGGELSLTGNSRHGIACSKNITLNDAHITVNDAVKDAIRCDKLHVNGGVLSLVLTHDGSKGVKCKEDVIVRGGHIEGTATGNVVIEGGETTYCTLMKCGGGMKVDGGYVMLSHHGLGGRCLSVDGNLQIKGGTLDLQTHGLGGSYTTATGDTDYFTPKCITADGTTRIERGQLHLLSTGDGGKGLDCSDTLFIGRRGDDFLPADSLLIDVETRGTALVDNVDEDYRRGCPKAIKSDQDIDIYSGCIDIKTLGQGGEGIESKETLHIGKAELTIDAYDDAINTGHCCHVDGARLYCLSHYNDGIDSNGSIIISDGIVASVNQRKPNESFDSEGGECHMLGGTVFGIGSMPVDVETSALPCYTTPYDEDEGMTSRGLILTDDKYICVQRGGQNIMALRNDNRAHRSFVTILSPDFTDSEPLTLSEGDSPTDAQQSLFGGRLLLGGAVSHALPVIDIQVQTIK